MSDREGKPLRAMLLPSYEWNPYQRLLAASSESGIKFLAFMAISSPERQPVDSSALFAS